MKKAGFSTVELLVTLFVAAAFLLSGYQLYAMIIKDGGETRAQAKASNTAYDYLQQYKSNSTYIKKPCQDLVQPADVTPTITGLSNLVIKVAVSCPYGKAATDPAVTKILVTVNYGTSKSVTQATYVTTE